MLLNNTSYRKQATGIAFSSLCSVSVCSAFRSIPYSLPYDSLQSSKDFIN